MAWAQTGTEFGTTTATDVGAAPEKNPTKERRIWSIYKRTPENTLSGNVCFEEVTRKMGFEYVIMPTGENSPLTGAEWFFNNLGVRLGLIFRAGPWWPITLAIKRKQCRKRMGDFVG